MDFKFLSHLEKRKKADVLVVPFWKEKEACKWAVPLNSSLISAFSPVLETNDFKGKEGETLYLYVKDQPEQRVVLLGLGKEEKLSSESLRRSYGSLIKSLVSRKLKTLNLMLPVIKNLPQNDFIQSITEGLLLANYSIDRFRRPDPDELDASTLIQSITWIGTYKNISAIVEKTLAICTGVYYARDLVNGNADDVTPQYLEHCARELNKEYPKIKITLFDKKRLQKEKMDLLLAVNRGSALDPAFIILEYKGNPKSKDHTVLVGKGVTYDTGGLNIKTVGMEIMKCDMGGGAVCFGTMLALAKLNLKINVTALIPATENCVDAKSFKPGDVYGSYLGKSVEMMNSDAEGRLILADALAYAAQNLKPTRLIDFATLTGAIDIALGSEATGMMATDDNLAQGLIQAGEKTFERIWRMPLYEEYKERLKSDIADIKSWNGRSAGCCVAAIFLKEFTSDIPWAHLDIASTAYITEPKKYLPKYATGVGVRLMIEFLEQISHKGAS